MKNIIDSLQTYENIINNFSFEPAVDNANVKAHISNYENSVEQVIYGSKAIRAGLKIWGDDIVDWFKSRDSDWKIGSGITKILDNSKKRREDRSLKIRGTKRSFSIGLKRELRGLKRRSRDDFKMQKNYLSVKIKGTKRSFSIGLKRNFSVGKRRFRDNFKMYKNYLSVRIKGTTRKPSIGLKRKFRKMDSRIGDDKAPKTSAIDLFLSRKRESGKGLSKHTKGFGKSIERGREILENSQTLIDIIQKIIEIVSNALQLMSTVPTNPNIEQTNSSMQTIEKIQRNKRKNSNLMNREFENNYTTKRMDVVQRVQEVREIIKSLQTIGKIQRNKQYNSKIIKREFESNHTKKRIDVVQRVQEVIKSLQTIENIQRNKQYNSNVTRREFENDHTKKRKGVVQQVQEVVGKIKSLQTIEIPQRNRQQNSNLMNREFGKDRTRKQINVVQKVQEVVNKIESFVINKPMRNGFGRRTVESEYSKGSMTKAILSVATKFSKLGKFIFKTFRFLRKAVNLFARYLSVVFIVPILNVEKQFLHMGKIILGVIEIIRKAIDNLFRNSQIFMGVNVQGDPSGIPNESSVIGHQTAVSNPQQSQGAYSYSQTPSVQGAAVSMQQQSNSYSLSDEMLMYLRKPSSTQLTTSPASQGFVVNIINHNNVNNEMDIQSVVQRISAGVSQALNASAEGMPV